MVEETGCKSHDYTYDIITNHMTSQIRSAYKHWVHPLTDEDGIDLMLEGEEDKPTIMMLINKLIPRSV